MSNWSRFLAAGLCALGWMLAGASGHGADAVDTENTGASPKLWLTRAWETDDGLPDDTVTGVAQAPDGQMWVATLGGLMRFDGERFEAFSTIQLPKVPNRVVRAMYLDRHGCLWLAMDRGAVIRVDATTARTFDASDGFPDSRVTSIAEDSTGGVWFVCANEVCRIQGDHIEHFGTAQGLPAGGNYCLATDERGQLWFTAGARAGVWRNSEWKILLTLNAGPIHLAAARSGGMWVCTPTRVLKFTEGGEPRERAAFSQATTVYTMFEDHTGALWIGTAADGLLRLDAEGLAPMAVPHPQITALTEDREGNIWVGTAGGGLNLLRPRAMNLTGSKGGLPFDVLSICQDAGGWVWAALQNGSLARGREGEWKFMSATNGWPGGVASCVTPARDGGVWIGTRNRGLQHWQAGKSQEWSRHEGLGSQNVRSLLAATNGDLWLSTDTPSRLWLFRAGAFREIPLPGRVRGIRTLAEGTAGIIWAGTSDGQVLRIQNDTVVNEPGAQKGPPYSIRCLLTTSDGSLWIGYAGWGLGRWHEGRYERVSTAQGLHDDYVSQMLLDDQGGVWVTSNHGLYQVRLDELVAVAEGRAAHLRSIAYGREEGLPSLEPVYENHPTAWAGTDGRLWFSTRKGVLMVQPGKIRDNPIPPTVFATRVMVDDRPAALYDSHFPLRMPAEMALPDLLAPGVALELPPGPARVEIDYTALSFNSSENVQFRYRLNAFDTDWVEAGTQRSARYSRLPAGRYEFEVTACNEAGVWSKIGFHVPLIVRPFFWQTWWFDTVLVAAFTGSVIAVVRYVSFRRLRLRMRLLQNQAALDKERARIAKDLHDDLGASMTQLTLVLELALQQRPQPEAVISTVENGLAAAREAIKSLDAAVWAVNPANNTLPELVAYIGQFAMEFLGQANIRCRLDLPDHPPERAVSAELRHNLFLIVKEALNNVVRHAHATEVRLQITLAKEFLDLLIADNGRGIDRPPADTSADGLRNMRQRAEELEAEMRIDSAPGTGTVISFRYFWPALD